MAEVTASNLAKYLISYCTENRNSITNLKLQKLLYYSQAWYLALRNNPLFDDRIEAWVHGPVVPPVFREYRNFKWSPLSINLNCSPSNNVRRHIAKVLAVYGKFDAFQLERLAHSEDPWKEARIGIAADMPSDREISCESMRKFYAARLNG